MEHYLYGSSLGKTSSPYATVLAFDLSDNIFDGSLQVMEELSGQSSSKNGGKPS